MATYESVLCVKNEVFVFKIPARTSNRGYRAAEWKLDNPEWTGRMKIVAQGKELAIRLEDRNSGDLFAKCPIESYPSIAVEQVLDSSRYFVLRIQDESGRSAFIGIGFADRGDSFDLLVALQDHFKWLKREEKEKQDEEKAKFDPGPKLDLGFKEGQTIRINIQTKKNEDGTPTAKPRNRAQGGGNTLGLLPPPPGGMKIPGPPPQGGSTVAPPAAPVQNAAPVAAAPSAAPSSAAPQGQSNMDLLLDLGAPSQPGQPQGGSQPAAGGDPWGDFTGIGGSSSSATSAAAADQNSSGGGWVSFE